MKYLHRVDTLLFDLDGTLADTLQDLADAINATLNDFSSPPLSMALVRQFIGQGIELLLERSLKEVGRTTPTSEALPIFIAHYERLNGQTSTLYPDVWDTLLTLQGQGYKLGCVTNKREQFARPLLARLGLFPHPLSVLLAGDNAPRKKPHPDLLLLACARLGSEPEKTIMVGDSINDILAARAAGCRIWAVSYGYGQAPLDGDVVMDGFREIPTHLAAVASTLRR